jgi:hypothetical protein
MPHTTFRKVVTLYRNPVSNTLNIVVSSQICHRLHWNGSHFRDSEGTDMRHHSARPLWTGVPDWVCITNFRPASLPTSITTLPHTTSVFFSYGKELRCRSLDDQVMTSSPEIWKPGASHLNIVGLKSESMEE